MLILSQGTDTVNKKLAVFTYVYFFVTEAQKSSKNKNNQPQLKNLTFSYIKKLISSVGRYRRDLYLLCYHDLRNSRKFCNQNVRLRLERSIFLKSFEKNFFMIFSFLLKRSFQVIFSCSEILNGSA